jgi:serine/threonine-protein kinase
MWTPEQQTFEPGERIGDDWEVVRPLGRGGMGSVYACRNRHAPAIRAAIKTLQGFAEFHPIARRRFLREAEILYRLRHPNVVEVRNIVLDGRPPWLEMELVEGNPLTSYMLNGPMGLGRTLEITRQLADALAYMHRRGVSHRDIKPDNVLVQADGRVKLVDFGLAKETGGMEITLAGTNTKFGTVEYCPPEWMDGDIERPELWDAYALGVLLHEMLTGDMPFQADGIDDDNLAVMAMMVQKQDVDCLDPGPGCPEPVREVVRMLTRRDAGARQSDLHEVRRRLDTV